MANQNKQTNAPSKSSGSVPKTGTVAKTPVKNIAPKEFFAFEKENYILMVIGVLFIVLGFALMSGGKSADPNVYEPALFSTRRIVIAPIVVLIGYIIELVAILKKKKSIDN